MKKENNTLLLPWVRGSYVFFLENDKIVRLDDSRDYWKKPNDNES